MTVQTKSWIEIFAEWAESDVPISLDFQGQQIPPRLMDLIVAYSESRDLPSLEQYQAEIREINELNGWFDSERSFGDDIALLHTEVSEMFEAYRDHGLDDATAEPDHHDGPGFIKPEGVGSEAADVLVRLLDTCERQGIDLRVELERKLAYNRTRGHRHGGKRV